MGIVIALEDYRAASTLLPATDEFEETVAWLKPHSDFHTGWLNVQKLDHERLAVDYERTIIYRTHGIESPKCWDARKASRAAEKAWREQCLKQMFIPATAVRHLRWKQDWARRNGASDHPLIVIAISRDEAALAVKLAAVSRQQAARTRKAVRS